MIIGVVVGAVVVVAAIAAFVIIKRCKPKPPPTTPVYYRFDGARNDTFGAMTEGRSIGTNGTNGTNGTKTIGTNGTGGRTTGSGTDRTSLIYRDDMDVILDVKPLLHHRLELSDLHVTSNKPLASGAFGEVWLGSYGGKLVAIKRMKSQDARMVQKFIDEIVLMSQYVHTPHSLYHA